MVSVGPQPISAIREGTVKNVNFTTGTMRVALNLAKTDSNTPKEYDVPFLGAWTGPNGEFSGGVPTRGSTVWIGLGEGGQRTPIAYVPSTDTFGNSNKISVSGFTRDIMSALRPGRYLTQVRNNNRFFLDPDIGYQVGNPCQFEHVDPNHGIISYRFNQSLEFTNAHRKITGIVKRDLASNSTRDISGSALTSHIYNESLEDIGLDPITKAGVSFTRNPPLTESHEIIYEYSNSFGFTDFDTETDRYDTDEEPELTSFFDRRESRADALSLSLVAPNQLIETIKGTAVDIYGNPVDLNRAILPSGSVETLSLRSTSQNTSEAFINLLQQQRKTIAYHFEMNARKDSIPGKSSIDEPTNYARDRSRLSVDVDKEGQFKVNIPASSETGNVPLLVRYENYSTLRAFDQDDNPKKFIRNVLNKDIFHESFGVGVINLTGGDQALEGFAAPDDRITSEPIKLGTAYHNLDETLQMHQREDPVVFDSDNKLNDTRQVLVISSIDEEDDSKAPPIVSPNIVVSGPDANAGGRSGTINLDGMINISVGANTIDRQSMWADYAGGIVQNIGRDINNRSYMGRMDGDVLVQIGGTTITNDSRFADLDNALRDGALDIRVVANAQMTIVRIDASGVRIATPGQMDIVSAGDMRFKSLADMKFDAKGIYMYADGSQRGRWVKRDPGVTI